MNRFTKQTASFYIGTIIFVLILFKVITTYGEATLKAPPSIGGSYKLEIEPQANCPNLGNNLLAIQQSGIYLNATLLPNNSSQALVEYPKLFPLSGKLQQQQLNLAGTIAHLDICSSSMANSTEKNSATTVQIQAKLVGRNLQGKITINSQSESLKFTAINGLAQ